LFYHIQLSKKKNVVKETKYSNNRNNLII